MTSLTLDWSESWYYAAYTLHIKLPIEKESKFIYFNILTCDAVLTTLKSFNHGHRFEALVSESPGILEYFATADLRLSCAQFTSIPDQRYEEHRRSSDFIKEYIFPGACLPSLTRVTSAMASASRLWWALTFIHMCMMLTFLSFFLWLSDDICICKCSVEHLENMGIHYYQTLICWRDNFMTRRRYASNVAIMFLCKKKIIPGDNRHV